MKKLRLFELESRRKTPFVLASGSSGKRQVLRSLNVRFLADPADIDEESISASSTRSLLVELSSAKAAVVADRHPRSLVLGADTLVEMSGTVMGKPKSKAHAIEMLETLSGTQHDILTGLTIIPPGQRDEAISDVVRTSVTFQSISRDTIEAYVETGEPFGKAGSYGIQGIGAFLVKKITGEYSNVMGMPASALLNLLRKKGYTFLAKEN